MPDSLMTTFEDSLNHASLGEFVNYSSSPRIDEMHKAEAYPSPISECFDDLLKPTFEGNDHHNHNYNQDHSLQHMNNWNLLQSYPANALEATLTTTAIEDDTSSLFSPAVLREMFPEQAETFEPVSELEFAIMMDGTQLQPLFDDDEVMQALAKSGPNQVQSHAEACQSETLVLQAAVNSDAFKAQAISQSQAQPQSHPETPKQTRQSVFPTSSSDANFLQTGTHHNLDTSQIFHNMVGVDRSAQTGPCDENSMASPPNEIAETGTQSFLQPIEPRTMTAGRLQDLTATASRNNGTPVGTHRSLAFGPGSSNGSQPGFQRPAASGLPILFREPRAFAERAEVVEHVSDLRRSVARLSDSTAPFEHGFQQPLPRVQRNAHSRSEQADHAQPSYPNHGNQSAFVTRPQYGHSRSGHSISSDNDTSHQAPRMSRVAGWESDPTHDAMTAGTNSTPISELNLHNYKLVEKWSCSCRKPDTESMVRCAAIQHDGEGRFHIECVGLDQVPNVDSFWICDKCKEKRGQHTNTFRVMICGLPGTMNDSRFTGAVPPSPSDVALAKRSTAKGTTVYKPCDKKVAKVTSPTTEKFTDTAAGRNSDVCERHGISRSSALPSFASVLDTVSPTSNDSAGRPSAQMSWHESENAACIKVMTSVLPTVKENKEIWQKVSDELKSQNIQRSPHAVKNQWNRFLRLRSGLDERAIPRPQAMQTGMLPSTPRLQTSFSSSDNQDQAMPDEDADNAKQAGSPSTKGRPSRGVLGKKKTCGVTKPKKLKRRPGIKRLMLKRSSDGSSPGSASPDQEVEATDEDHVKREAEETDAEDEGSEYDDHKN